MKNDRIILGIDPGSNIMGFGVLDATKKQPEYLDMGMLDLRKDGDHYDKLKAIFQATVKLIENYSPTEVALEAPFFGKNVQSMLKLGRAQGVAMAAALHMDLPIYEYAPRKIKLSITGLGQASKEQVSSMLQKMFVLKEMPKNFDASDGLAVAVCHFYESANPYTKASVKNWGDYIKKNPGKVKG